jgi:hypothetical protein
MIGVGLPTPPKAPVTDLQRGLWRGQETGHSVGSMKLTISFLDDDSAKNQPMREPHGSFLCSIRFSCSGKLYALSISLVYILISYCLHQLALGATFL